MITCQPAAPQDQVVEETKKTKEVDFEVETYMIEVGQGKDNNI